MAAHKNHAVRKPNSHQNIIEKLRRLLDCQGRGGRPLWSLQQAEELGRSQEQCDRLVARRLGRNPFTMGEIAIPNDVLALAIGRQFAG